LVTLTFTVLKDELLSGEKTQTIRRNNKFKVGDKLDIWWGNPRFRDKSVKKLGIGKVVEIEYKYGYQLSKVDAVKDGFTTLKDLLNTLIILNKMSKKEVIEYKWLIIKWNWIKKYWK